MQDVASASLTKERILATIRAKGPSLPIPLARAVNISPLFASAFLSELYGERKIRISNMRVGSSPLYYIEGQEPQLETFVEHLNNKEKEAFSLLKNQKILDDETLHPAIRVALRGLKDFAIPIKSPDNKEKLYWRYFLFPESEIQVLINPKKEEIKEEKHEIKASAEQPIEKIKESIKEIEKEIKPVLEAQGEQQITLEKPKKAKKTKELKESDLKFSNNIRDYLQAKDVEILSVLETKKKDFTAKIRLDTLFGKQEYYLIAKDKKKVTEEELTIALHKAQENKMPALIMIPGEIDKRALQFIKDWRNLIKFEKIKF